MRLQGFLAFSHSEMILEPGVMKGNCPFVALLSETRFWTQYGLIVPICITMRNIVVMIKQTIATGMKISNFVLVGASNLYKCRRVAIKNAPYITHIPRIGVTNLNMISIYL